MLEALKHLAFKNQVETALDMGKKNQIKSTTSCVLFKLFYS